MNLRTLAVCALPFLALTSEARAQVAEVSLSMGQSIFRNEKLGVGTPGQGDVYSVGDGFRIGARLTLNTYRFFGHEIGYSYSRSKLVYAGQNTSMTTHQYGYSFLAYMTPEGSRIRPFAAGGGQFTTFYPPGASTYYGNGTTKFGLNYGVGVKAKLNDMFAIRVDLRDYWSGKPFDLPEKPSGGLHQIEASAGLSLYF
jgi:Outer membrane protein beta-barrel domain